MREYESTLIIQPEISDEGVGTLQERLDGILEGFGCDPTDLRRSRQTPSRLRDPEFPEGALRDAPIPRRGIEHQAPRARTRARRLDHPVPHRAGQRRCRRRCGAAGRGRRGRADPGREGRRASRPRGRRSRTAEGGRSRTAAGRSRGSGKARGRCRREATADGESEAAADAEPEAAAGAESGSGCRRNRKRIRQRR